MTAVDKSGAIFLHRLCRPVGEATERGSEPTVKVITQNMGRDLPNQAVFPPDGTFMPFSHNGDTYLGRTAIRPGGQYGTFETMLEKTDPETDLPVRTLSAATLAENGFGKCEYVESVEFGNHEPKPARTTANELYAQANSFATALKRMGAGS